ncbi:MAG: response regulator transcription factor [Verrucomicrobia bacterium]|nr:response regulator transcription factor [Verrucomicrobiota bacterium]
MKIRTLIVDDEALARERLAGLLRAETEIEIIGQCADGREAVEAIRRDKPDLVFLDVQMPELDGFGVLTELGGEVTPEVVFVTAYDQFAVKAFEIHAVDYVMKPFDRERLQTALRRAVDRLQQKQAGSMQQQLAALLADLRPEEKPADRLAIKTDGRVVFVKFSDIDWVEAADNYVKIHVGTEGHMLRETMNSLEARLPAKRFLRISRSTIVNVEKVKELQPLFHGDYAVILRNGAKLTLSRGYREKLRDLGIS